MEILFVFIVSVFVATSGSNLPEVKNSNQSNKAKITLIDKIKSFKVEAKPELVEKVEAKPELVEKVEAKPEEPIKDQTGEEIAKPVDSKEDTSWLNIILYLLGAISLISAGIYFYTRKGKVSSISAVDMSEKESKEQEPSPQEQEPSPQEQEPSPQEQEPSPQEQEPSPQEQDETQEDNASDDNKKQ